MKIIVGTKNSIKVSAVEDVCQGLLGKNIDVIGVLVNSGVSNQPVDRKETILGAYNRARNALAKNAGADYGVGLESGVITKYGLLWAIGYVVVVNKKGQVGIATTVEFPLPMTIQKYIEEGLELGEADAKVFQREDAGNKEGTVGLLTRGVISRKAAFKQTVAFAFVPLVNPEYENDDLFGKINEELFDGELK